MAYLLMHYSFGSGNGSVVAVSLSAYDMAKHILLHLSVDNEYYSDVHILEKDIEGKSDLSIKVNRHKEWDSYHVVHITMV